MALDHTTAALGTSGGRRPGGRPLAMLALAGAAVALSLGAYARLHAPARRETLQLAFSGTLPFKAWTTTLILALALFQLLSALRLYGRLRPGRPAPAWLGHAHRLSGTLAFAASLPVAFHCLWSIGLSPVADARAAAHTILGCTFYGAVVVKVGAVRSGRLHAWALPVAGGVVFTALVGLWLTSSLWFFTTVGLVG
ncbi:MAG TPA: DUF6529 family protein [Euzebyales bacterium]|nr:DUF6529 family protein [Euzebyales bacterium]